VVTIVRRCLVLAVLGAVVVAPMSAEAGVAALVGATCQGRTATLVGSPHRDTLTGTAGDDVIVSNGSTEVVAGDGDDVVCVTGQAPPGDYGRSVDAGSGDDDVVASLGKDELLFVSLGAGADRFTGGRESDIVTGGTFGSDDGYEPDDSDADVIDAGAAGADLILVGDGGPLTDRVRVRSPRASVYAYASGLVDDGSLSGESWSTLAWVDDSEAGNGAWALDLRSGTAALDGTPTLAWTGFGRFVWAVPGTVEVQGTDDADVVAGPLVGGQLGAGDDTVAVWSSKSDRDRHVTPLDGGPGRDVIRVFATARGDETVGTGGGLVPFTPSDVTVDVARQRAAFGTGESLGLAGFEWYGAETAGVATLIGSSGDDALYGAACDLRMRGGSGDDNLRQVPKVGSAGFTEPSCSSDGSAPVAHLSGGAGDDVVSAAAARSVVRGGAGTDVLMGGNGRDRLSGGPGDDRLLGEDRADVLVGGSGTDLAQGGRGEDTCRVEYGSTCEQPRSAAHLTPVRPGARPHAVRLVDPHGDVEHVADLRHPAQGTRAPDVRAGDVVATRTVYRHGELTLVTRFRSLRSSDEIHLGISLQYSNAIQFLYGDVSVEVPPHGRAHATANAEGVACRPDLDVDRARAHVTVSFDASCLDNARWVRTATRIYTTDDLDAPSYFNQDLAPDGHGRMEQLGPKAWAR
jgi:Ca2+-binding RTX toxin-like protein